MNLNKAISITIANNEIEKDRKQSNEVLNKLIDKLNRFTQFILDTFYNGWSRSPVRGSGQHQISYSAAKKRIYSIR